MLLKAASSRDYMLTVWLFLRCLALIYFVAFLSLSTQILGLFGSNGILPTADFLQGLAENLGKVRYWICPNIFWLNSNDWALLFACLAGVLFASMALCGICTGLCFLLLWILYLSFVSVGQDFLSFQWDALLLETGFLTIFLAPWQYLEWPWRIDFGKIRWSAAQIRPSILFIWLVRWLLFRLMFESGFVKLASGDTTWRDLTALDFHYFTQPLPTPMAWFAAQAPHWLNSLCVLFVLAIELVIPSLIFMGRKTRLIAFFALSVLQIVIVLTGNYAYFNLLTLVLCISLLDDEFIKALARRSLFVKHEVCRRFADRLSHSGGIKGPNKVQRVLLVVVAVFVLLLGIGGLGRAFSGLLPIPEFLQTCHDLSAPYFIANTYGLFAVMTTERLEISIEGSDDGNIWQEYKFKYKPGDLNKAPPVVAPFQPRLDWQMWFAALGDPVHNHWFMNFLLGLLHGQREILNLLAEDPFPDGPPNYIRATFYNYHFTNSEERKRSGNWWKREFKRRCVGPLSLKNR